MSEKFTPGPWRLCFHLRSAENDASCPCGYRGGVWGPDGERIVCEMGADKDPLAPPRYERAIELANARLIAAAPTMFEALPDLSHVIIWLRNGCEPAKAADELQLYQKKIDAARATARGEQS